MEQKLVKGNKYLIKRSDTISMIEVLLITETSYKFKYESGNTDWITKEHFHAWYTIIEDVSMYESDKPKITTQPFKTCPICHGVGTVPDSTQTVGTKPCPLCIGNKIVPNYT